MTRRNASRQAIVLLLAVAFYRQLSLPSPLVGVAVYLWVGAAVVVAGPAWRRRVVHIAASLAVALVAIPVVLRVLRIVVDPFVIDGAILLWPYHVLPALAWVLPAWLTETAAAAGRRGRAAFPVVVVAAALLLLGTERDFQANLVPHPAWYVVAIALLLVFLAGATAAPRTTTPPRRIRRRLVAIPLLAALFVALLLGVFGRYQGLVAAARGGLIEPTLFRFDFSDYVDLESEIQLGEDLVLVYHEPGAPPDRLIRRHILAGYDPGQGFYRVEIPADVAPPSGEGLHRKRVTQEYYFVNLAPSALVGANEPLRSTALDVWDDSSFSAVRRVESAVLAADEAALRGAIAPDVTRQSGEWRERYLAGDVPADIAALASAVVADATGYYGRVRALESFLLTEYCYSLSPGVSPDGDQLGHFLFESRKGYCSYFAFAMALMARSQGIPARVAVGFFLEEESELLDYYAVRENAAHAWVEVYFDEFGWVEFDPTSQILAPGEAYAVSGAFDSRRMAGLVEEIIHAGERPAVADAGHAVGSVEWSAGRRFLARWWAHLVAGIVALLAAWDAAKPLVWRLFEPRRRTELLFRRGMARLARFGLRRNAGETYRSFSVRVAARTGGSLAEVVTLLQRARYGGAYRREDADRSAEAWKVVRLAVCSSARTPRWVTRIGWSLPSIGDGRAAAIVVVALMIWGAAPSTPAQSVDEFEDRVWDALDAENYDRARTILGEARSVHPEEPIFPLLEADLYFDRELYVLAEERYRQALELGSDEWSTRYDLSRALARQNRDAEAIRHLEWIDDRSDPDLDVTSDLAWLYFKSHRLEEAVDLLEATSEALGRDRYLEMTLGTVRGAQWDYGGAAGHYHWAIEDARRSGDAVFEAVAEYNLSILETVFYRFDAALAAADRSLAAAERASGHLIRGELMEQRLDYRAAVAEYLQADALDPETVLPEVSLAVVYLEMGHLERARALAAAARETANPAWLYNYGTDLDRHAMRLAELTSDTYAVSSALARIRPGTGLRTRLGSLYRRYHDALLAWYHRGQYVTVSLRVGKNLAAAGQELDANWTYLTLLVDKGRIARPYLERARELETSIVPTAERDYRLLKAQVTRDRAGAVAAYGAFLGPWYGYGRHEALRTLLEMGQHRRDPAIVSAAYAANPALFVHAEERLPVRLDLESSLEDRRFVRTFRRALRREGISHGEASPLGLRVTPTGTGGVTWSLSAGSGVVREGVVAAGTDTEAAPGRRMRAATWARAIGDALLSYPLPADNRTAVGQP